MTTTTPTSGAPVRSRLEPEPMPRRDFLGLAATWSAIVAAAFAVLGMSRLPRAAVVPVPSRKFRVTLPDNLATNVPLVPPGRSAAIFRDADGVFAVSMVCTHLGCIVKTEADGFHCPCHGSRFALDGAVVKGPAPQALAWLGVARVGPGTYVVDEGKPVPPGTKVVA